MRVGLCRWRECGIIFIIKSYWMNTHSNSGTTVYHQWHTALGGLFAYLMVKKMYIPSYLCVWVCFRLYACVGVRTHCARLRATGFFNRSRNNSKECAWCQKWEWIQSQEKVSCLKAVAPLSEDFVKRRIVLFLPHVCLQQFKVKLCFNTSLTNEDREKKTMNLWFIGL